MSAQTMSLAMLIWSLDVQQAERVATPLVMAQAAVALDAQVELFFSARSVTLLMRQEGARRVGFGPQQRSLAEYLFDTHALGVRCWACAQALHALGLGAEDLSPHCAGVGGSVQFMARALDPRWRTLVF